MKNGRRKYYSMVSLKSIDHSLHHQIVMQPNVRLSNDRFIFQTHLIDLNYSEIPLRGHDINPISLRRGYTNINENLLQHQSCFNQQVIELSDCVISPRQQTTLHYQNLQNWIIDISKLLIHELIANEMLRIEFTWFNIESDYFCFIYRLDCRIQQRNVWVYI